MTNKNFVKLYFEPHTLFSGPRSVWLYDDQFVNPTASIFNWFGTPGRWYTWVEARRKIESVILEKLEK